jgi:malonyl-CoA/methylmalonyl-CoA synthetase
VTSHGIELLARAAQFGAHAALGDETASLSYAALLDRSARAASMLLDGAADLNGARVAFLVTPGIEHVVTQWAIWRAGGIAVPLCSVHPPPELAYVLDDAQASIVVADDAHGERLLPLAKERGLRLLEAKRLADNEPAALPAVDAEREAMLIYTSGTTGKPKGAVSTHAIIAAQCRSLVKAWAMVPTDRLLHALPLHHLHGVLNALCAPLWAGGSVEFLPRFDAERVWARLATEPFTLFMAVPTMYAKLAATWDATPELQRARSQGCQRLRLMCSGSAALPVALLDRWRAISGHVLLERYGMTELGMVLGNPLEGERRPGHVGIPFPNVQVRIVDEASQLVTEGTAGRLQVRGPNVFAGYWQREDATREAFTEDGWFETGDVAVLEDGSHRLLGRESVDILKTGGYKVSALEIEETLREHPSIAECAVVGVADDEWGQRVAAAVVLAPSHSLDLASLRDWGKARLAPYKVPTLLRVVGELPRNALGKVQKPEVTSLF